MLLFIKTKYSDGLMDDASKAASVNTANDAEKKFSILHQLEDFRSPDGEFKFMLCYPNHTPGQRVDRIE